MTDPIEDPAEIEDLDPAEEEEQEGEEIEEEEDTEEVDPDSPDLTAHLPVTVIEAKDEAGKFIFPEFIRQMLTNLVNLVLAYTTAHAVQTGQHSESFIAWRSNLPSMTEEEKSAEEFTITTKLHNWLWTDASAPQLVALKDMLDEMMLDTNRALINRQNSIKDAERGEKVDLKVARKSLTDTIDGTRATAKSNILPGFTEDLILGLPEITIKRRVNSPEGVYGFPSAPKVMSEATEKKKNGGQTFRSHNTRVRILVDGKLLPDHPGTLGGATSYYLHKDVKEAGKIFEDWKTGSSWTDEKTGTVYTWCYEQDAPKVEKSGE
jgi:hypothetical protein